MKTRRYAISPLIQVKLNSNLVHLFSLGTSFIISNLEKLFLLQAIIHCYGMSAPVATTTIYPPALRMHNKYIALHPTSHYHTNIRLFPMHLAHPKLHQLVPRIAKHHRSASQQSTPQHTTIHYLKASIIFVVTSFKFISNIQTLWVNSTQLSLPISLKLNQSLFQCFFGSWRIFQFGNSNNFKLLISRIIFYPSIFMIVNEMA